MFRNLAGNLNLRFFGLLQSPSTPLWSFLRSHPYAIREMVLQQATSEDSGHWDFALLMFYDELVRSMIFSGFTAVTDFGWSERAAVVTADLLNTPEPRTLLDVCQTVQHFFVSFGKNMLLVTLSGLVAVATLPDVNLSGAVSTAFDWLIDSLN